MQEKMPKRGALRRRSFPRGRGLGGDDRSGALLGKLSAGDVARGHREASPVASGLPTLARARGPIRLLESAPGQASVHL